MYIMGPAKCQSFLWMCYYLVVWIITAENNMLGLFYAEAKFIEGDVDTAENWIFLTRFCFYSQRGQFAYKIQYPESYAVQKILLYYDEPYQWSAVYKTSKTCFEKEAVLIAENHQFIELSVQSEFDCHYVNDSSQRERFLVCEGERRFETARERWWFVAVSNCASKKGLKFKYRIKMTNGNPGDLRHEHFSADEFGILEMSIAFSILDFILMGLTIFSAVSLRHRYLLHTTYKIFMVSLAVYCMALLLLTVAYSRYATDGVGLPRVKLWGQILQSMSLTCFLLLLLLLAKGYTVTRAKLRRSGTMVLWAFMVLYSVANLALFAYKEKVFDPGEVLYLYESPPGLWLIILKLSSWAMFVIFIVCTLKRYPEKAMFYFPFLAFYTLWFVAGPIIILFANYVIDKWVREKVVFGVDLSMTYLAFLVFWCLTIPTFANVNFPFHVRTTQIGVCHVELDGTMVTTNLEEFPHHPYAPSAPPMPVSHQVTTPSNSGMEGLFVIGQNRMVTPDHLANSTVTSPLAYPRYHGYPIMNGISSSTSISDQRGMLNGNAESTRQRVIQNPTGVEERTQYLPYENTHL